MDAGLAASWRPGMTGNVALLPFRSFSLRIAGDDLISTRRARRREDIAAAPNRARAGRRAVRGRRRRQHAHALARNAWFLRSELGAAFSLGGRAQSIRPVPGRAGRQWRLAQA